MHELKTSVDFKFSSKVWCSMRERNLVWAREEKCFQLSTGNCKKLRVNTEWRLALNRVVARNRSYQFLANENQGEKHAEERRCLQLDNSRNSQCHNETLKWLSLDILMTWECMIENIFPHLTTQQSKGDFFRRKLDIDWRFQLVSYLGFIVLWLDFKFELT